MKRRTLARRLDDLDGGRCVSVLGAVWVRIEIVGCTTQADYDRVFAEAWEQVPVGAAAFCFQTLPVEEWQQACDRYKQGLPPVSDYRCGIYLKEIPPGAE